MTLMAREVLRDCEVALNMLELEKDLRRWRIIWAGSIALIRAVGHVLHKVDGSDKVVRDIANEFFARWKSAEGHDIFRDFVEHERNNLLKEYRSDVHPLESVPVAIQATLVPLQGGSHVTAPFILGLDENLFRPMLDGPWEGVDCREVYEDAIAWWKSELDKIDVEVLRRRGRDSLRGDMSTQ
jgi:hypothetical protein